MIMRSYVDHRYGLLVVTEFVRKNARSVSFWKCLCDCGNYVVVRIASLRSGATSSCGCVRLDRLKAKIMTHGLTKSGVYNNWYAMLQRCYNTKHKSYRGYGAKGITVCDSWRKSIQNFYDDLGPKPSSKHTLDRIDPNGNYEPSNCRWANKTEQIRNRKNAKTYCYKGKNKTVGDWAKTLGLNPNTINNRIRNHGWSIEKALEIPIRQKALSGFGKRRK